MDYSNVNTGASGVLALFMAAVCAMGALYYTFTTVKYLRTADRATGVVVEMAARQGEMQSADPGTNTGPNVLYAPVIRFSTGTNQPVIFTSPIASYPPRYSVGENVPVLYMPSDPLQAKVYSLVELWFVPAILFFFMSLMLVVGEIILWYKMHKENEGWLMAHGRRIQTQFQKVETLTIQKNGKQTYAIVSTWQDSASAQVYTFRSKPIAFDPQPFIKTGLIAVWINPVNPARYLVDATFLPKDPPPAVSVTTRATS